MEKRGLRIIAGLTGVPAFVVSLPSFDDDVKSWAGWMSNDAVRYALWLGSALLLAYAALGDRLPRFSVAVTKHPPRSPKATTTPAAAEPDPPLGPDWITLHPLVIEGQLRITLRHREWESPRNSWSISGAEVEVEGPDGTFTNVRAGRGSGHANSVYTAHYPQDFEPTQLTPGRYTIRWFGRNLGMKTGGEFGFGPRIPMAESSVVVRDDGWVDPC